MSRSMRPLAGDEIVVDGIAKQIRLKQIRLKQIGSRPNMNPRLIVVFPEFADVR